MSMAMDLELKRAFTEMQVTKLETTKKISMIDSQIGSLKTSKQKYEITHKEVSILPPDTRVFQTVGRMFVLSSIPEVSTSLNTRKEKCDSIVSQFEEKKQFLEKNLKEQETNLRELVQHKKSDAK